MNPMDFVAATDRIFEDGSCPPEVELAAQVSFELDNAGPRIAWEDLDESDRSFHRRLAVAVLSAWQGKLFEIRAAKALN